MTPIARAADAHARALDAGETTASSSDDAAKTLDGPGGGRRAGATSSRGGGLGGELADLLDLDALAGMVTVRCVLPAGFEPIPNDLKLDEGVTVGALKLKVRDLLRWSGVGEAEKGGGAAASAIPPHAAAHRWEARRPELARIAAVASAVAKSPTIDGTATYVGRQRRTQPAASTAARSARRVRRARFRGFQKA